MVAEIAETDDRTFPLRVLPARDIIAFILTLEASAEFLYEESDVQHLIDLKGIMVLALRLELLRREGVDS